MSELNIMEYLIEKNNDKGDLIMDFKTEPVLDLPTNYENTDMMVGDKKYRHSLKQYKEKKKRNINRNDSAMSSDFFDSIFPMGKNNMEEYDAETGLFDNLEIDIGVPSDNSYTYDDIQCETSTFSDSGLSSDQQDPTDQTLSDDELLKTILYTQPVPTANPVCEVKPTVIENPAPKPKIINVNKPIQKHKQVIRVQPLNGNSRSVLLPINIKDLKTIKIINANSLKAENVTITSPARQINQTLNESAVKTTQRHRNTETVTSSTLQPPVTNVRNIRVERMNTPEPDNNLTRDDNQYPLLLLTPEEKRLLSKDGIQLPCRYPLTKHEERELKRIRRKIRNKISAQDSRKRKKEYVDGLEERVKQCSEENRSLLKRIKLLQTQNSKLSSQLSKLQALVFKTGASRAHPATCIMIVLLSVMLVTLPNLRNAGGDKQLSTINQCAQRRALLFSKHSTMEDEQSSFSTMGSVEGLARDVIKASNGVLNTTNEYAFLDDDESYEWRQNAPKNTIWPTGEPDIGLTDPMIKSFGSRRWQSTKRQYIEPDIDETWPPEPKKMRTISVTPNQHIPNLNYTHLT